MNSMTRKRKTSVRRRRHTKRKQKASKFSNALHRLKKLNASQQSQAIKMSNNAFIRQFCNQIRKLKHAKLSAKVRTKLRKHRKNIRKLLHKSTSMESRRKLLSQKGGGFLKNLLTSIPIVGDIVSAIDTI